MNRDEGSYQLPHLYDYLLFAAATPGGPGPKKTAVVAKTSTTNYVTKNVIWWTYRTYYGAVSFGPRRAKSNGTRARMITSFE